MTQAAWPPAWLVESARRLSAPTVWRGVESQHASATTVLVDSLDEHEVLEGLLETSKPPQPATSAASLHFLLTTPFRYTPAQDSRFRKAGQGRRGLWYGSPVLAAACSEVAYWRQRFILDSAGLVGARIMSQHTFFAAAVAGHGIDLMAPPWAAWREAWVGSDYTQTHRLAAAAEPAGIAVIRYESARAPGCACLAVLTPDALQEPKDGLDATRRRWTCTATRDHVMMRDDADPAQRLEWAY